MADTPDVTTVETDESTGVEDQTLLTSDTDGADSDADQSAADTAGDDDASDASDSDATGGDETGEGGDNAAPDTYADFNLPDGVELDSASLEQALPIFKEMGLTQDQAQKLVTLQSELVQAGAQKQLEAFTQLKQDWRSQSTGDKEFGGDKFNENVGIARKAIDTYGTPELSKLMDDYGIGNHPEVIRFMWSVGQTLQEDVPGGSQGAASKPADRVSLLYPNDTK